MASLLNGAVSSGRMTRNLWLIAIVGVFFLILVVGAGFLSPTRDFDARMIEIMAIKGSFHGMEGSFATMSKLYSMTNSTTRVIIVTISALSFIIYCGKNLRSNYSFIALFLLLISPIVFFLTQFNKDTVLVWVVIFVSMVLLSKFPRYVKLATVCVAYVVYANLFRSYYYLICAVFLGLCFLRFLPTTFRVYAVVLLGVLVAFTPADIFAQLQGSRDFVNADRVGRTIAGARTAFMNLERPEDYWAFVKNYVYAAVRLNLPIFFGARVQELFLFLNVGLYLALFTMGAFFNRIFGRAREYIPAGDYAWSVQTSALLFGSHVLVLICFEPDLGSYLRHMSSALPYLVPVLIAFDRAFPAWRIRRSPARSRLGHSALNKS